MPKSRRQLDPRQKNREVHLNFDGYPTAAKFVAAIGDGDGEPDKNEIAAFGTRGDGKTIAAMTGMILHAQKHHAAGFPLPVPWMGVTDTFTSHKLKTVRSFENPIWQGGWKFRDGDHIAVFSTVDPATGRLQELVKVDLFGIEDQGAMDRVRMETVGVWFEEPAPSAVMVQSSGVGLDAWMIALTSRGFNRIPSHFYPAVTTLNYPDEDHWTWNRFVTLETPGTRYFRIPPGERASEEDRESWKRALADRPDLLRRLIQGEPGVVMLGQQVAQGFTRDDNTTLDNLPCTPATPLWLGFDFGHTPTCVIGQPQGGILRVKAGLYIVGGGQKQLMDEYVLPWLGRFAPWALRDPDQYLMIGYDPSQGSMEKPKGSEADIENAALMMIQQSFAGGWFEEGPIQWEVRKDMLVQIFQRKRGVLIESNDYTRDLIRALDGRWYYAKSHQGTLQSIKPKKPNVPWSDLGDAFTYMLARYGVGGYNENAMKPLKVLTNANIGEYESNQSMQVLTNQ